MNVSGKKAKIIRGCGYWDVTHYPRGGCFRRAVNADLVLVIQQEHQGDIYGMLEDGKTRVCANRRVIELL
jgi:hypothetical protein